MSDFEYRVLRYLQNKKSPALWSDIINDFAAFANPVETDVVLKSLLASGLIRATASDPQISSVYLSDSALFQMIQEEERLGKLKLVQQENERKEKEQQQADQKKEEDRFHREQSCKAADRKAEHAFQYKLAFLNAFLTFLSGMISGAILANLDRLIPWVLSLFP